ncbi:transmembrane 4 L6 family member 19 isoform X3 [Accipiter gentilis]|uniref:transmembrane 4 L6 family member 19 isoform X3 n=1 Tax=Astur gentilis TaxID=8957 RepID=UPI00210FA875|nr:transmembrane 4 L6 family member 19 isoform X3 [Accipiter gentilis]
MPPGQGSSKGWTLLASCGITSRVAMCVGKCSRIVGPCLLALGTLSVAANILLLFPGGTSKYLVEGHISKQARAMPGVWGGGITVSTAVCTAPFLACLWSRDEGTEQVAPLRPPAAFSFLQVLLAATHITAVGWRCAGCSDCGTRRNHGRGHGILWDYPFLDAGGKEPDTRAQNYLYDRRTWSTCLEPEGIVAWNVVLFSLLLLVSATEMVLASLQILNGCLGCLCGFCEGK